MDTANITQDSLRKYAMFFQFIPVTQIKKNALTERMEKSKKKLMSKEIKEER
jgi:hypothetical protein